MKRIIAASLLVFLCAASLLTAVFADTDPNTLQTEQLEQCISDAADAKVGVKPSTDGTDIKTTDIWAPQSAFNALNASIAVAKDLLNDKTKTQELIDGQTQALKTAITTFRNTCKYGTKIDTPPKPEKVNAVFLKSKDIATDGKNHFVGEDFESKYKTLSIAQKGKTIQLNGYYSTNLSEGVTYETMDSSSPLGVIELNWNSSDKSVAVVDPSGIVTPLKDGETTITATVAEEIKYEGAAPNKQVKLKVSGQTGPYVSNVLIIDENGKSLSSRDDVDTVMSQKNTFLQFYALVTWHDPSTGKDSVEDTRKTTVSSSIKWTIGGSNVVGTINADTGRFKSSEYTGNCFVQCTVTGGLNGATVKDTARLQVDTGVYAYKPSDSLTLKVVYEKFPDKVVQTHTYPMADLSSRLGTHTDNYTVLGGNRYGTIRASGFLFKDIVGLEGIDIADVYQYRFKTADGYDNPITTKLLFGSGSRYYFPNWDVGKSRQQAVVVPPILATSSNMMWGQSEINPDVPLDIGSRFRLVFGALWGGDANSSYQIYYIQSITIVLKGSPPADNGKGTGKGNGTSKGNKSPDVNNKNAGVGDGTGSGMGSGSGSGSGSGKGSGSGRSSSAGSGVGTGGGSSPGKGSSGGNIFDKLSSGGKMKIFEMISNSKSDVAPLDMDLPYLSAAVPIGCGGFVAGGLSFLIGYRRRKVYREQ